MEKSKIKKLEVSDAELKEVIALLSFMPAFEFCNRSEIGLRFLAALYAGRSAEKWLRRARKVLRAVEGVSK